MVVENYPQLKSNENFLRLQDELAGSGKSHQRGAPQVQRGAADYNTTLQLFPNNIVASMSGFTRNDAYFKTEPGADKAPKVQF